MAIYSEYFNLHEAPFSIAPDPRYLYMSEQHREAFAHLLYGIQNDCGFVVLAGEFGTAAFGSAGELVASFASPVSSDTANRQPWP